LRCTADCQVQVLHNWGEVASSPTLDALVEGEKVPQIVASSAIGVSLSCVLDWRIKNEALSVHTTKDKLSLPLSVHTTKDKLSLHKGPASILDELEQELVEYITMWRMKGFPVSRMSIVRKVGQLRPDFGEKSLAARKMSVSRFLTRNQLTHRVATHKAQRCPGEVRNEALAYLEVQVPRVNDSCHHQDFILNMDQTPMYQAMAEGVTIDFVGARTVNLRTSANDSQRVTVAVTIAASGKQLKSMIIFKGEFVYHQFFTEKSCSPSSPSFVFAPLR